jgi:hypothetical protein
MPSVQTHDNGIDLFWPSDMPLPTPSENDDGCLTFDEGSLTDDAALSPNRTPPAPRAYDSSDSDGPPASDADYVPHTPRSGGRERPVGGPTKARPGPMVARAAMPSNYVESVRNYVQSVRQSLTKTLPPNQVVSPSEENLDFSDGDEVPLPSDDEEETPRAPRAPPVSLLASSHEGGPSIVGGEGLDDTGCRLGDTKPSPSQLASLAADDFVRGLAASSGDGMDGTGRGGNPRRMRRESGSAGSLQMVVTPQRQLTPQLDSYVAR